MKNNKIKADSLQKLYFKYDAMFNEKVINEFDESDYFNNMYEAGVGLYSNYENYY